MLTCILGWTGPALIYLDPPNGTAQDFPAPEFHVSDGDKSWIGSLMPLGALFGGNLSNHLGKYVMPRWSIKSAPALYVKAVFSG